LLFAGQSIAGDEASCLKSVTSSTGHPPFFTVQHCSSPDGRS
jgi:hypothetical protein